MQTARSPYAARGEERQDVDGCDVVARPRAEPRRTIVERRGSGRGSTCCHRRRRGGYLRHRRRARTALVEPRRNLRSANDGSQKLSYSGRSAASRKRGFVANVSAWSLVSAWGHAL